MKKIMQFQNVLLLQRISCTTLCLETDTTLCLETKNIQTYGVSGNKECPNFTKKRMTHYFFIQLTDRMISVCWIAKSSNQVIGLQIIQPWSQPFS